MYANLDFNIGSVNPSGIGTTVYRIRKRYITAWPTIVDDPDAEGASESGMASYAGNFTTQSGKYWQKIYSTQAKGSITSETTGETDCKMFINHGNFSFPDLSPVALGFAKASVNDDFVYIAKAAGRYHVIGSPDYRSTTSAAPTSGDAAGSAKGITFTVDCPDVTPLPMYAGTIELEEGTLDLSDGSVTPRSNQ